MEVNMALNVLSPELVAQLDNQSSGIIDFIPEHGCTTLMCTPTVTIPRAKLIKWEKTSRRHQDIIAAGLKDGAVVYKTALGHFLMK